MYLLQCVSYNVEPVHASVQKCKVPLFITALWYRIVYMSVCTHTIVMVKYLFIQIFHFPIELNTVRVKFTSAMTLSITELSSLHVSNLNHTVFYIFICVVYKYFHILLLD